MLQNFSEFLHANVWKTAFKTEKNHVVPYFNNDQTCHFRAEISHVTAMIIRQFLFSMEQEDSL